jgi:hypothetical protein
VSTEEATAQATSRLREVFMIEQPPPSTPAIRRLRAIIALTAATTVVVELLNLEYADESGVALAVGTVSAWPVLAGFALLTALLGADGLVRDGVPMVVAVAVGLYALRRSA